MGRRKIPGKRRSSTAPWHKRGRTAAGGRRRPERDGRDARGGRERDSAWIRVGGRKLDEDTVVGFIYQNNNRATLDEISRALIGDEQAAKSDLSVFLQALCQSKTLACAKDEYTIGHSADLVVGELSVLPRGFGFVAVEGKKAKGADRQADIFVPGSSMKTAMQGDRVLVRVRSSRKGRLEGAIVRVLARAASTIVGIFKAEGPMGIVNPEDKRFPFNVMVNKEESRGAKNGEAVVVEITEFREDQRNHIGRVVEVLGDPESMVVQNEIVIREHRLPHVFSPAVKKQAEALEVGIETAGKRLDLRDIQHVTIDGETARDFDDAVAIDKTETGYRLYVSIADVSHYVQPGTPIDLEAYQRGTSVYFPSRVVPMLPEKLSNNLCSLVPDEDRLAFTAILEFDRDGNRVGKKFAKSIIRSRYRLTYTIVKQILVDRDKKMREKYQDMLTPLKLMGELAAKIGKRRMKRGSIGFEIPEAQVILGEENEIKDIVRSERNKAHKLIEEFMLAANEAVASTFTEKGLTDLDFLYRIHEKPDPIRVEEFAKFAQTLGIKVPDDQGSPQWFGKVLELTHETPYEYIVSNLLLRTMKQACYAADNVGHFGLAASDYCHFTSPIRRYPDLMVHRALQAYLEKKPVGKMVQYSSADEAGTFLSKRERVAVEAEREMVERLTVRYMASRIGEGFEGIISGVTSFGLFIELLDSFVNGAAPITEITDDYYSFDEKNHRLVGRASGRILQLGDQVMVRVASVDIPARRINFMVEHDG